MLFRVLALSFAACLFVHLSAPSARAEIAWGDPVAVDTGVPALSAGSGNVLASFDGQFWVVYQKGGDIYAASGSPQGWTPPVRLTSDPATQTRPSVTTTSDYLYVIWEDLRGTQPEIWSRRFDGSAWSTEQAVTANDGVASRYPVVAGSEYASRPIAAWEDSTTTGFRVYYCWYGSDWEAPVAITDNTVGQRHPSIAALGYAMVAWEDYRHGDSEIYERYRDMNGWSPEMRVSNWPEPCTHPSAAADLYDDMFFMPFVAFEAGDASGGAEIRVHHWTGAEYQISAEDGIPSRRPNATQFLLHQTLCESPMFTADSRHQVTWTDVPGLGAREHYVWNQTGDIQPTPGDGVSYSGIVAQEGTPTAQLAQAWIENRSGVFTLVARLGTTAGCNYLEFQATPALLIGPDGVPDNLVRTVNPCDGSPRDEELSFWIDADLNYLLTWDIGYPHGPGSLQTGPDGEARFALHGGGCATFGYARIGCTYGGHHQWTGAKSPDVNGDCQVLPDDLAYVQSKVGTSDFCADLDQSGIVGPEDVAIVEATMWGHCTQVSGIEDALATAAPGLHASPNPAREAVRIVRTGPVTPGERLLIADAGGRLIRELAMDMPSAITSWDLKDDTGRKVAAGLYFVLARSETVRFTAPVIVLD